jgi:ribosomal protein L24E
MSTNLNFATSGLLCGARFVLVNDRVPRTDQHCAFCGVIVEKGYVRDSQTRFIYCDTQCFAGGARLRGPVTKNRKIKVS